MYYYDLSQLSPFPQNGSIGAKRGNDEFMDLRAESLGNDKVEIPNLILPLLQKVPIGTF
jgi:hypothetical protein